MKKQHIYYGLGFFFLLTGYGLYYVPKFAIGISLIGVLFLIKGYHASTDEKNL